MWRMFGWLGRTVAAALIVSFLAIWTTGYIVNSYVETLLKQYNLPIETQPFALSGVWGKLWGAEDAAKPVGGAAAEAEAGTSTDRSQDGTNDIPGINDNEAQPANGNDGQSPDAGDSAIESAPVTGLGAGAGPEAQGGQDSGGETVLTPGQIAEKKEQLNGEDRSKLFALLVSRLPQEEWQTISVYVEDGLTGTELTNIQQIVAKYLNQAEYDEMMTILSKY
ncbi:hypothetical protein [Paenibacillus darwinianus]|uniref:hypothetical protein n=1 Tax=Paenibacillus darwinianus TaxID=1380763 RepID=UPI000450E0CB|nr:hypothetical protein [Paenibacillus darwinianus]EXX85356.1 hypothetical protein CH50_09685 [Paenibacillus darwinianus]